MRVANWNLQKADPAIMNAAMDRLEKAAGAIASAARALCPVGVTVPPGKGKWSGRVSGDLLRSIRVVRLRDSSARNVRIYAGSRKVFYARFVEHGTRKMRKRPFLRPAFDSSKPTVRSILLNGV